MKVIQGMLGILGHMDHGPKKRNVIWFFTALGSFKSVFEIIDLK